jgi:hypothetical protein
MKTFKQVLNEVACDSKVEQDDMSKRELQVAVNAAQEIISMLDSGATMERWGESKVTLASDYLVSVCTYMKANGGDQSEELPAEEMNPVADDIEYVGHEYAHLQPMFPFVARVVAEEKKASKAEAKYQDKPKNGQRCVNCTMWREPNKCTAVSGTISPNGWCAWYEGGAYGNKGKKS